jgi:hypothetical protein
LILPPLILAHSNSYLQHGKEHLSVILEENKLAHCEGSIQNLK